MIIEKTRSSYNEDFYIMFDGMHYAISSNYSGLVAYTKNITRSEDYKSVKLDFIICDLLPIDKTQLKRVISKMERKFCSDKKLEFTFSNEREERGYSTLQDHFLTLNINNR